ncbi:hypothetical protein V5O48_011753 [Marasmius crinis-equi]|uniref:Uncharacterized protein n=1 Tax=Marasmius crinis-equi TaxID=585013 RepID=A0ABR3F4X3_9AGAR
MRNQPPKISLGTARVSPKKKRSKINRERVTLDLVAQNQKVLQKKVDQIRKRASAHETSTPPSSSSLSSQNLQETALSELASSSGHPPECPPRTATPSAPTTSTTSVHLHEHHPQSQEFLLPDYDFPPPSSPTKPKSKPSRKRRKRAQKNKTAAEEAAGTVERWKKVKANSKVKTVTRGKGKSVEQNNAPKSPSTKRKLPALSTTMPKDSAKRTRLDTLPMPSDLDVGFTSIGGLERLRQQQQKPKSPVSFHETDFQPMQVDVGTSGAAGNAMDSKVSAAVFPSVQGRATATPTLTSAAAGNSVTRKTRNEAQATAAPSTSTRAFPANVPSASKTPQTAVAPSTGKSAPPAGANTHTRAAPKVATAPAIAQIATAAGPAPRTGAGTTLAAAVVPSVVPNAARIGGASAAAPIRRRTTAPTSTSSPSTRSTVPIGDTPQATSTRKAAPISNAAPGPRATATVQANPTIPNGAPQLPVVPSGIQPVQPTGPPTQPVDDNASGATPVTPSPGQPLDPAVMHQLMTNPTVAQFLLALSLGMAPNGNDGRGASGSGGSNV